MGKNPLYRREYRLRDIGGRKIIPGLCTLECGHLGESLGDLTTEVKHGAYRTMDGGQTWKNYEWSS